MRLGRHHEATEAADRALILAEPLRLERTIAEAMANKAPALAQLRRPREGTAILRAAADLAAEAGDMDLSLRALTNLGVFLSAQDLSQAMRTWNEALDTAGRLGQRKSQHWVWTVMTAAAVEEGRDWDGALRQIEEVLADLREPSLRMALLGNRLWYLIYRGQETDATWAQIDALREEHPDTDEFISSVHLHGFESLLQGRVEVAISELNEAIPRMGQNKGQGYGRLLLAGLYSRDLSVIDTFDAFSETDSWVADGVDGIRQLAVAGRAAIEGRPADAVTAARASVSLLEGCGWTVPAAEAKLFLLRILPDQPEFGPWVAEARAKFEQLGMQPYLRWLDGALANVPADRAPSVRPEVGSSR